MRLVAYHSTGAEQARSIMSRGFRIPRTAEESSTDAPYGDFFPAIFFARSPDMFYGPALFEVMLEGKFTRLRPRRGESYAVALHRAIGEASRRGIDGVDSGRDDVGIAVVNPDAITMVARLA